MIPFHFAHPLALPLLLLAPLLYFLHRYGDRRRRIAFSRWSTAPAPPPPSLRRVLQAAAIVAIALALADPTSRRTGPTAAPHGSADIVFLLDVSRSMLAADVAPSRLARAKGIIREIAAQDRGNRVALLVFAGGQSVECPLTVDHAFFAEALDNASPDSVPRGGTRIGDAIHFAVERVFDDVQRDRRTIVVLSDGEDHESSPVAAAADAARAKVHIVTIGIGEDAGAVVPVSATDTSPFLYRGEPVRSRLDAGTLRAIGRDGAALSAGNGPFDAARVYRQWLAPAGQGTAAAESAGITWAALLSLAIILLVLEPRMLPRQSTAALLAGLLVLRPFTAHAQTVDEWFNKGLEALDQRQYVDAMRYFADASRWAPDIAEIRFNLAKSLYELHSYAEAALAFEHAAQIAKESHLKAQARLGQGNALFRDATEPPVNLDRGIPGLRAAIEAYRAALKIEPGLFAADINLKVAERRLREYVSGMQDRRPPQPGTPPQPPQPRPPANADDILRQNHRAQPPRTLAKPGAVDKDW
jgi:Ca-activated chloride channel family protein